MHLAHPVRVAGYHAGLGGRFTSRSPFGVSIKQKKIRHKYWD